MKIIPVKWSKEGNIIITQCRVIHKSPRTPFFVEQEISATFAYSLYWYTIANNAPLLNIRPNGPDYWNPATKMDHIHNFLWAYESPDRNSLHRTEVLLSQQSFAACRLCFAECVILMHHRKQFIKKQEVMEGRQRGGGTPSQAGKPELLFTLQHYRKAATKFRDPFCLLYRILN